MTIFRSFVGAIRLVLMLGISSQLGQPRAEPLTWRWSNPRPHGNNIFGTALNNQGLLVQTGERGQIYTTDDLRLWVPRDSHTTNYLRAITFFNNRIVVTGESGTALYADSPADFHLLDLRTTDWLEGVAASANVVVAVGDNAAVYSSPDAVTWTRQSVSFSDWLRSVSYGTPNGNGEFVAVGESGAVAVSGDGLNWQKLAPFTSQNLNKVVWATNQFWVLGEGGTTFVSPSGSSWSVIATGATNDLFAATVNSAGARLVAGDSEVRLLEGRSWSNEIDPAKPLPPPAWTYFNSLWMGNEFLLSGRTGMIVEGFKTNSVTSPTFWLPLTDSIRNWLWEVHRFPGLYLAVGDRATLMSSGNGIDWDFELVPDSLTNSIFLGVGGKTNLAVAVGNAGAIMTSADNAQTVVSTNADGSTETNQVSSLGIFWSAVSPRPTTADLQGVAAFGSNNVVTGGNGTILTSTDGNTWTTRQSQTTKFLSSVTSFPGGLIAVGAQGTILASSDAVNWATRRSGTTNWLFRVRYTGGKLIAVGQNGSILTSADGSIWTKIESGTTSWLNDVIWAGNHFYVIGTVGTVLESPDATTWTSIGTITEKALYGAASSGDQLIATGVEGIILRTHVTPQTSPVLIQYTLSKSAQNAVTNSFLFSGQPDQRFLLDRTEKLPGWATGPKLEFLDSSGLLLYTEVFTNAPSSQLFRARVNP